MKSVKDPGCRIVCFFKRLRMRSFSPKTTAHKIRRLWSSVKVLPNANIGATTHFLDNSAHNFSAGRVAVGVNNAEVIMAAFATKLYLALLVAVKLDAIAEQPANRFGSAPYDHLDRLSVAKCAARDKRVVNVILKGVVRSVPDRRNTSLRFDAVRLFQPRLAYDEDLKGRVDRQRRGKARETPAYDQHVGEKVRCNFA